MKLQLKKGYIKEKFCVLMNLKDRGITVGDLLIIIIILSATFFVKALNKDKKTSLIKSNEKITFNKGVILSNNHFLISYLN